MDNPTILILLGIAVICSVISVFYTITANNKTQTIIKNLSLQYNALMKMQQILKNKFSVGETTDKAEIIYQDLLQDLISIMAAMNTPKTLLSWKN